MSDHANEIDVLSGAIDALRDDLEAAREEIHWFVQIEARLERELVEASAVNESLRHVIPKALDGRYSDETVGAMLRHALRRAGA